MIVKNNRPPKKVNPTFGDVKPGECFSLPSSFGSEETFWVKSADRRNVQYNRATRFDDGYIFEFINSEPVYAIYPKAQVVID